jgi:hypothetical protein
MCIVSVAPFALWALSATTADSGAVRVGWNKSEFLMPKRLIFQPVNNLL